MKESHFFQAAKLVLRIMPAVSAEKEFALKGGSAINFFIRNLPRLSVDIDLTYLPLAPREESLTKISQALVRIAAAIKKQVRNAKIGEIHYSQSRLISKLVVRTNGTLVKIEPNSVLRGAVYPAEVRNLSAKAEETFAMAVSALTLDLADIYAGKLCAALDRQHPRDLFDIKVLFEHEGITDRIRKAFVVYLASSERPMHELLEPRCKDITHIFEGEFAGMTLEPVNLADLLAARESMIAKIAAILTQDERHFLLSIKEGKPNWDILGLTGIEQLPAIQWKLQNIRRMDKEKHREALRRLRRALALD